MRNQTKLQKRATSVLGAAFCTMSLGVLAGCPSTGDTEEEQQQESVEDEIRDEADFDPSDDL